MLAISRREFSKGAAGLFGWGLFSGGLCGCRQLCGEAGPRLRLGVISDIHICLVRRKGRDVYNGEDMFRAALEWFRDQGVDGVAISGDLSDQGLVEELAAVGRTWRAVFPGDRAPDGRRVEKLFVYGNHDWEGFRYSGAAKKMFGGDLAAHTIRSDLAAAWEKAFGEEYSPVWHKEIKGYTFIGAHWTADVCRAYDEVGVPQAPEWFRANGSSINPSKPFFYLQHPPPKNTCHGPSLWGHDDGRIAPVLARYPNAIALTGHSHASLSSDKAIWQGEFTAIDAGSLSCTGLSFGDLDPYTRENDSNEGRLSWTNANKVMRQMPTGDGHQGMLATVFDSRIEFVRRDFGSGGRLGDDWVVPLPAEKPMPFAFEPRAAASAAPEFPAGAALEARMTTGRNRGGGNVKSSKRRVLAVTIPAANRPGAGRVFDFAVEISGSGGGTDRKFVFASGFHRAPDTREANGSTVFQVDAGLLEARGEWLVKVVPRNCFGMAGSAICTTVTP